MAYIPLKTVKLFAAEFEKKRKGYTVEKFCHGDDITVEAQTDYYTNYILSNPDWEFVKVYTDI